MRRRAGVALVLTAALAYPLAVLAGGSPRFPTREECVRPATDRGELRVVFAYTERAAEAAALRDRVVRLGFVGTGVEQDGCGRLRVAVDGVPSITVGQEVIEEARSVGLNATLEQAG